MLMRQHFYFCLGYETEEFTIDFWTEALELAPNEVLLFEDYGFQEFQDKLEKFCSKNNISYTIEGSEDSANFIVGKIVSGSTYDSEDFTFYLSPEQLQLETKRLKRIFGKKPSIYTGVYYC